MRTYGRVMSFVVAVLSVSGVASGATLFTAPLNRDGHPVSCLLANVSTKPITDLEIGLVNFDGTEASLGTLASLDPGRVKDVGLGPVVGQSIVYCRFTFTGSKRAVRATGCVKASATDLSCVAATGDAR